ncbi:MAG: hypothetical protein HFK06_01920 [Clostridia bacterium]|nr:hypothetical protein [Clostridia bacterium]
MFAKGLLSDYIDAMCNDCDNLEIPLCFPVCHIPLFSVRYYWIYRNYSRIWKKYLKAAINYPFLKLIPSFVDGRLAIDGGAADNIPLYPLLKNSRPLADGEELDLVFVLHFDARYDYRREFKTDVPVIDLDLSYCNDFSKAHYDYSKSTTSERIEKACLYGEKILSRIFAGECTKESIQKAINDIFLEEHTLRQQNFSIDRLLSFLNVAGKALRNDAYCVRKLY